MATAEQSVGTQEQQVDKGLKAGALGLISTTIIATASVAPAYSIAATLVFVVCAVALQSPAAEVLVMASLAQVAGQYGFLLFNAKGIGSNPTSGWVLLVGVLWIVVMTYICYRGIEVSANFQKVLLGIELVMLAVLSITALVKV